MSSGRFSRLQAITGIDFHVAVTLMFRSWGIIAGAVMVFAIPATLDASQQGYYFTFASILGLQIFFELGLNQVVIQLVGHEMAQLAGGHPDLLLINNPHTVRLKSIVVLLRKWYTVAAILFACVTSLVGVYLFAPIKSLSTAEWLGPWLTLVIVTSVNLYFSPILAVMEGCSFIGQVARLRLVQSILGSALTWGALFAGFGLWAIPLMPAVAGLCTIYWLNMDTHFLRSLAVTAPITAEQGVDWRREVLPFQWRIAVSWISGYLMFQLFTPMVFVNLGPVAAGRLGITLAIFNSILAVGISWINAKAPQFSAMISKNDRAVLNILFLATLKRSLCFVFIASLIVLLGILVCKQLNLHFVERMADLPVMTCLALVTLANVFVYAAATYIRSHRQEPMLPVSVICAILTLVAAEFGSRSSLLMTVSGYAAVTLLISLPWTARLFLSFYRRKV